MPPNGSRQAERDSQAGFTLIEALIAMVVLVFGIIAVTNLMVVASTSNSVARESTLSANVAQRELERLRSTDFVTLAALPRNAEQGPVLQDLDGDGNPELRMWWTVDDVVPPDPQLLLLTLRVESQRSLVGARARAVYTLLRSCTDTNMGCPAAP